MYFFELKVFLGHNPDIRWRLILFENTFLIVLILHLIKSCTSALYIINTINGWVTDITEYLSYSEVSSEDGVATLTFCEGGQIAQKLPWL